MINVKCKGCGRWLCSVVVFIGAIKCPRCKKIFEYKVFNSLHYTNTYDKIKAESKRPD